MLRCICCTALVLALFASILMYQPQVGTKVNLYNGNPGAAVMSNSAFDPPSFALDKFLTKLSPDVLAAQTKSCAGLVSPGNPYLCCNFVPNSDKGNCVFGAWEKARQHWAGQPTLPAWQGNAQAWLDAAEGAGYPTVRAPNTPPLFSVAVSKTMFGGAGHVGLLIATDSNSITLRDQWWCSPDSDGTPDGTTDRTYPIGNFAGYIKNKATFSESLPVYGLSPQTLYSGGSNQQVLFSVGNIQGDLRAIVTFPNGGRATLAPWQQIWVYGFQTVGTRMVLGNRGWYSIQFFNTTGVHSQPYWFWVN